MPERQRILREVMLQTSTTQSELSRLSGVRQPSISQFLSGKIDVSDEQLDRLLSCMGFRLEVARRPILPELTHAERRSWQQHRLLSRKLNDSTFSKWVPTMRKNLRRLNTSIHGQPHERNLHRWRSLIAQGDVGGLHRVLTGLDRDSIEMREVSPMGGLLSESERLESLGRTG